MKQTRNLTYESPRVLLSQMDFEGLICGSFKVQTISDWENVNADESSTESFYLESY